jgi:hypothetical protein
MSPLERAVEALNRAKCPGREGPFGGYDYGYPNDRPVEGGRYVIRDFRDLSSPDWGRWLHQTNDREEHERQLQRMKDEHIVRAVIAAIREPGDEAAVAGREVPCEDGLSGGVVYSTPAEASAIFRTIIDKLLAA